MRYKLLGKSGLRVSELALGTMTFGEDWGWGASKEISRQIFETYVDRGGNFIDTAGHYTNGTSEKFIGEFIATDREYFVVGTKYTLREEHHRVHDPNAGGNHRKNMLRSIHGSLKHMNLDYVDVLWLHFWDNTTPMEEILRAMDDLIRGGKVLYIGISDTPAWVTAYGIAIAELRGWSRFIGYQGEYNLLGRGAERELLPMTRALDMAFLVFGLLEGGTLTGKFNQPRHEDAENTREDDATPKAKEIAKVVMEIAAEIGRTPAQVAINWVRQQSSNIIPIIGARSVSQIQDNLGVLEFTLSGEHLQRLTDTNPLVPDYPGYFIALPHLRELVFGEAINKLDNHRA